MKSVVISGYYGFGNTGDEAVLEAMLDSLRRECPGVRITVLSASPVETARAHQVDSVHRFHPGEVWRALRRADLLLSGGGSLLQDVTSTRSLWYYLGVMVMARHAGARVMVYANGLGPLSRWFNRRLAAWVLQGADRITVRDPQSLAVLRGLGVRRDDVLVTADPAFALEPLPDKEAGRLYARVGLDRGRGPIFGLALRSWPGWGGMIAEAIDAVARCVRSAGGQVLLLPMQQASDAPVAAGAEELVRGVPVADIGAVPGPALSAQEILTLVGGCEVLVGMRLHALVFAAVAGVPFVGLAYDPKVAAFVDYVGARGAAGAGDASPAHPGAEPRLVTRPTDIGAAVEDVWVRRLAIRSFLQSRAAELRIRSRENARVASDLLREGRR